MDNPITIIRSTQPDSGELAAKVISLLCVSSLSTLFGLKTFNVQFKYLSYSKWIVLALYLFSWAFTVMGMILVTTNNCNNDIYTFTRLTGFRQFCFLFNIHYGV